MHKEMEYSLNAPSLRLDCRNAENTIYDAGLKMSGSDYSLIEPSLLCMQQNS